MYILVMDNISFPLIVFLMIAYTLIIIHQIKSIKGNIMLKLDALKTVTDRLALVVAGIQEDYQTLQATIGSLRGMLLDDSAQAEIDKVVAKLGESLGKLNVLDESVVPEPATPAEPTPAPAEPTPEPPPTTEG